MRKFTMMACLKAIAVLAITFSSSVTMAADIEKLAKTCAACHGARGVSNSPQWPNLAEQKQAYLADQMRAFREGTRIDPLMSPIAKGLSDQDIELLASHYAEVMVNAKPMSGTVNQAGRNISARCISCHGMKGKTVNSQWPNISGQKMGYLQKQLIAFRDGTRHSEVMKVIVKDFSNQQIADVAEYYGQQ